MIQFMDWTRDYGSVSKNKRQRDAWVSRKYLRKTLRMLGFVADLPGLWALRVYWRCAPTEVSWGWKTLAQCIGHHSEAPALKSERGKGSKWAEHQHFLSVTFHVCWAMSCSDYQAICAMVDLVSDWHERKKNPEHLRFLWSCILSCQGEM